MNRRAFLSAASLPIVGRFGTARPASAGEASARWRHFEITTRVTLMDSAGAAQFWLPLAQTAAGYQAALDLTWQGSGRTALVHDARYGADILHTAWDDATAPQTIEVVQRVAPGTAAAPTRSCR